MKYPNGPSTLQPIYALDPRPTGEFTLNSCGYHAAINKALVVPVPSRFYTALAVPARCHSCTVSAVLALSRSPLLRSRRRAP